MIISGENKMNTKVETVNCKKCFYFREHSNQFVDQYATGECMHIAGHGEVKETDKCLKFVAIKKRDV